MRSLKNNYLENYYTDVKGVKVMVDYTNERLKICDYSSITDGIVMDIIDFAMKLNMGKIISNCQLKYLKSFKNCGFKTEGTINGFFRGEDAYYISLFLKKNREISTHKIQEDEIIRLVVEEKRNKPKIEIPKFMVRNALESDIPQITKLFSSVFESYPSPIFSSDYLKEIMVEKILFKVIEEDGNIISIASADMDKLNMNAEITDCATYPQYRGKGLLFSIIRSLENDLKEKGFYSLYSHTRAINTGINKTLSKLGYKYNGRLINNCHICGSFEDMNIWVKQLQQMCK